LSENHFYKQKNMEFSHVDFSLMETEDLEILLKINDIAIKLAELEEKQRKANRKRRRRMRVQWTRDWIMRRTLFGQYENLLAELNREDPKRYKTVDTVDTVWLTVGTVATGRRVRRYRSNWS